MGVPATILLIRRSLVRKLVRGDASKQDIIDRSNSLGLTFITGSTQKAKRRRFDTNQQSLDSSVSPTCSTRRQENADTQHVTPISNPMGRQSVNETRQISSTGPSLTGYSRNNQIDASPSMSPNDAPPEFSQIMYPSHDVQTRPQSPSGHEAIPRVAGQTSADVSVTSVCKGLGISRPVYDAL